VKISNNIFY